MSSYSRRRYNRDKVKQDREVRNVCGRRLVKLGKRFNNEMRGLNPDNKHYFEKLCSTTFLRSDPVDISDPDDTHYVLNGYVKKERYSVKRSYNAEYSIEDYSTISHSYEDGVLEQIYDPTKKYVFVIQILMSEPISKGEGHWYQFYVYELDEESNLSRPFELFDVCHMKTVTHMMKRAHLLGIEWNLSNEYRSY